MAILGTGENLGLGQKFGLQPNFLCSSEQFEFGENFGVLGENFGVLDLGLGVSMLVLGPTMTFGESLVFLVLFSLRFEIRHRT